MHSNKGDGPSHHAFVFMTFPTKEGRKKLLKNSYMYNAAQEVPLDCAVKFCLVIHSGSELTHRTYHMGLEHKSFKR